MSPNDPRWKVAAASPLSPDDQNALMDVANEVFGKLPSPGGEASMKGKTFEASTEIAVDEWVRALKRKVPADVMEKVAKIEVRIDEEGGAYYAVASFKLK